MSGSRVLLLGLLVAGLVGGAVWWALGSDAEEAPVDEPTPLAVGQIDPVRAREISHSRPWPHVAFEDDLSRIKGNPNDPQDPLSEASRMLKNERAVYDTLIDIHLKDATVKDVVEHLAKHEKLKDKGVPIFTFDTKEIDHLRFDLDYEDIRVDTLIDMMRRQVGDDEFRYYMTSEGLCLGGVAAIQMAQFQAAEARAKQRAQSDPDTPLLEAEFRPDFVDAWIGPITDNIRQQTGVEVIPDSDVWKNGKTLTWRAAPMSLREALDRICDEMDCVRRVRDGRVFLIAP